MHHIIIFHKTQWANRFFFLHMMIIIIHMPKKRIQYNIHMMQLRAYRARHIDISGFYSNTLL